MASFIADPGFAMKPRLLSRSCAQQRKRNCLLQRKRHSPVMNSSQNVDPSVSSESDIPDTAQMRGDNDFIVDVANEDLDLVEEGLNVVNVMSDHDIATRKRKKVRKNMDLLVDEIDLPPVSMFTSDADRQPPIQDDETTKYVRTAVKAADQRKAEDIVALRISKLTYISSFIVVATGNNAPQLRAISNLVEGDLKKEHGLSPRRIDGVANSGWILLDYGDFLVNVFSPEQRRNYNLETLWKRGEVLDVSDCLVQQLDKSEPVPKDSSLDDWLTE